MMDSLLMASVASMDNSMWEKPDIHMSKPIHALVLSNEEPAVQLAIRLVQSKPEMILYEHERPPRLLLSHRTSALLSLPPPISLLCRFPLPPSTSLYSPAPTVPSLRCKTPPIPTLSSYDTLFRRPENKDKTKPDFHGETMLHVLIVNGRQDKVIELLEIAEEKVREWQNSTRFLSSPPHSPSPCYTHSQKASSAYTRSPSPCAAYTRETVRDVS